MQTQKQSEQLELDLKELETLFNETQRANVKFILQNAISSLKTEISKVQFRQQALEKMQEPPKKIEESKASTKANVTYQPITVYSWDQENNHVKIYISLDKIGELEKENIVCIFDTLSFDLKIHDFQKKNLRFFMKKLNDKIDVQLSKFSQRKNMIVIDMVKGTSKHWDALEFKESPIGKPEKKQPEEEMDKSDPQASLMNMMKKMYQEGDDEMKKTIAQAWQKSQDDKQKDPTATV